MSVVKEVFFLPPLAIARLGGSDTPLDSFVWGSDPTIHGSHRTIVRPAVSLEVLADGSLRPYWPKAVQFRDRGLLRPVAPFFELWVRLRDDTCQPLTSTFLAEQNASTDSVEYTVAVGNRKAQRRTGSAACSYTARVVVSASDYERKPLLAYSPHNSREEPLVLRDHRIPLGHFQVIKPIPRVVASNIHLGILRVRFTPARGEVYGPPTAIAGPASPLPPGVALPPVTLGGRLHDIVPPRNRILNPNTPWSRYVMDERGDDPQPSDSYDGANVGQNRSWGVVDDTCDGIIEAQVVIQNQRFVASARIFSSCPDYAPDRRPFYSVADDLADRDLDPVVVDETTMADIQHEIADLFERAFETASLYNLDAMRERAVVENMQSEAPSGPGLPKVDQRSMTRADKPPANLTADLFPYPSSKGNVPGFQLPYSAAAQFKHASLCDIETLLDLLMASGREVKKIVRPPFGRFHQLPKQPPAHPNANFRDPRVDRDMYHDMRMPPYMRDSDLLPLSITYRQHAALMQLIDDLQSQRFMLGGRVNTPIARRIDELTQRQATAAQALRTERKEG
jgi:hypothetical protein